jgi:putative transposase
MPNYIRNKVYGGTYFFTVVTKERIKFFLDHENAETLYKAIKRVQKRKPFELLAYCIMPDHWHLLLSLPEEDDSFSQKIREIKRLTTYTLRKSMGISDLIIWQDRFWEHSIRDENDLTNCFNYTHYNPVHHQLVEAPEQWKWSSYCDYYRDLAENKPVIDPKNFEKEKWIYGE